MIHCVVLPGQAPYIKLGGYSHCAWTS